MHHHLQQSSIECWSQECQRRSPSWNHSRCASSATQPSPQPHPRPGQYRTNDNRAIISMSLDTLIAFVPSTSLLTSPSSNPIWAGTNIIFPYMEYILSIHLSQYLMEIYLWVLPEIKDIWQCMAKRISIIKQICTVRCARRFKDLLVLWSQFHVKTVPDHYLDDPLQASPAETEVLQVFQGKPMIEWTYFSFKNNEGFLCACL